MLRGVVGGLLGTLVNTWRNRSSKRRCFRQLVKAVSIARTYVDLQHQDSKGRIVLTCQGTIDDLKRYGIELSEGMTLAVYTDAGYRSGRPEKFHGEGGAGDTAAKALHAVPDRIDETGTDAVPAVVPPLDGRRARVQRRCCRGVRPAGWRSVR